MDLILWTWSHGLISYKNKYQNHNKIMMSHFILLSMVASNQLNHAVIIYRMKIIQISYNIKNLMRLNFLSNVNIKVYNKISNKLKYNLRLKDNMELHLGTLIKRNNI